MNQKERMKNGESIRDVFATPEEVGSFIRSLLNDLDAAQNAAEIQRKAFAAKANTFRVELFSAMYDVQKRYNLTVGE